MRSSNPGRLSRLLLLGLGLLDFVNPRPDEIAVLIKARRRPRGEQLSD